MKKRVLFILLIGVFVMGVVNGATCEDDMIIMKLSSLTNAHGALYSDTLYDYEICSLSTSINRECDTPLLWLSSDSNAHVSTVRDDDVYNVPVCFPDDCSIVDISDGGVCEGEILASLSSDTNAHVSEGDDSYYPIKICCGGSRVYWANANGDEIDQSDEVNIWDTVQMVATGVSSGTFNIFEEDGWFNSDDTIDGIEGVSIPGKLIGKWKITQDDLDKTNDFKEFYFEIGGDKSGYINISGDSDDSPMNITIVRPECGEDFEMGKNVTIEVVAEDADDFINGSVSINDFVVENFTNGGITFNYTFGISGNVKVVAEAVNSRGKRSRHIANIMIIGGDGDYVAACISEPKDFSDMPGSSVPFDASNTRAISVRDSVKSIFTPKVKEQRVNFSWYWTFSVAEAYGVQDRFYNFIKNDSSKAYDFTFNFPSAGNNLASLRVDFE